MADVDAAFTQKILSLAGVTSHVARRVHWKVRPQGGALPALVLNVIGDDPTVSHKGPIGCIETRFQVDVYGVTAGKVKVIRKALRAGLHGFRGTVSGVVLQGVFAQPRRDFFEGEDPDRVFRESLDFIVWAVEP